MKRRLEDALRTVAAMPDDDWQPHHFDEFYAARAVIVDELDWLDRANDRKAKAKRERAKRDRVAAPSAFTEARGRAVALNRAGGRCEATDETGVRCPLRPVHVHHVAGRGGLDPHHPENLLALCHSHHDWVHANPEAARSLGLMRSRLAVES